MKLILLSLLATTALGVSFNTHTNCVSLEAACTGNPADQGLTCLGQDGFVAYGMDLQGYTISAITDWNMTTFRYAVRWAYFINQAVTGDMSIHADYEPILRCSAEQYGLSWSEATACFEETASCMNDAACTAAWDSAANSTKASMGAAFTYVTGGFQAIGDPAFSFGNDATDPKNVVPMTSDQLGVMNGYVDITGNGKAVAMMACMLNDWAAVPIQAAYPLAECFDVVDVCAQDADCVAASNDFQKCAKDDYDIDIALALPLWPTLYGVTPAGLSHDGWCELAACTGSIGNTLYMSMATCAMNQAGFAYKKCYDDMMAKIMMMVVLVGGVSFVVGVLGFTGGWCLFCRSGKGSDHEVA